MFQRSNPRRQAIAVRFAFLVRPHTLNRFQRTKWQEYSTNPARSAEATLLAGNSWDADATPLASLNATPLDLRYAPHYRSEQKRKVRHGFPPAIKLSCRDEQCLRAWVEKGPSRHQMCEGENQGPRSVQNFRSVPRRVGNRIVDLFDAPQVSRQAERSCFFVH